MVIGTYDGDQEETMDKVTQNLGFGYALNDNWTLGMIQADANNVDKATADVKINFFICFFSFNFYTSDFTYYFTWRRWICRSCSISVISIIFY